MASHCDNKTSGERTGSDRYRSSTDERSGKDDRSSGSRRSRSLWQGDEMTMATRTGRARVDIVVCRDGPRRCCGGRIYGPTPDGARSTLQYGETASDFVPTMAVSILVFHDWSYNTVTRQGDEMSYMSNAINLVSTFMVRSLLPLPVTDTVHFQSHIRTRLPSCNLVPQGKAHTSLFVT